MVTSPLLFTFIEFGKDSGLTSITGQPTAVGTQTNKKTNTYKRTRDN